MTAYRTISSPVRFEIDRIKGSRFIGDAARVESSEEAGAFVESVAATFPDANHHCFAWRLVGDEARSSDDGEPHGSAGRPILNRIHGLDLEHAIVVVTRYFGGTKLGVGGLVRAYGAAAQAVLDHAEIVEREPTSTIEVVHTYALSGAVKSVLTRYSLEPVDSSFGVDVQFRLVVPCDLSEEVVRELTERTAGQARITIREDGPSGV